MNEMIETKKTETKAPKIQPDVVNTGEKPATKTIAVKSLSFFQAHPDYNARQSISHEPSQSKGKVAIEFVPSLRHHRVETQAPNQAPKVRYIHECHVASWEPLA